MELWKQAAHPLYIPSRPMRRARWVGDGELPGMVSRGP